MNCITINTDASFHPVHMTSGYAFYIVCDLFKIQKGGNFKKKIKSPLIAEVKAIGNALATLRAQKELPKTKLLVINTDCLNAIHNIEKHPNALYCQVRLIINDLKYKLKCKVEFRHVKAHNGTPDTRSWVNDWCDKEAKRWMRKQIKNQ